MTDRQADKLRNDSGDVPALAPPPSMSGLGMKVVAAVVTINFMAMLWMAVRSNSDAATRNVLDAMAQLALGASAAFVAYRLLMLYPFRILDLMTIVMTLAAGTKVVIDALTSFSQYSLIFEGQVRDSEKFGPVMLTVLLSCSVLMAGAALGLRYCARLKIDRPLPRAWAVISGMLSLPASAGFLVFALLFLSTISDRDAFFSGEESSARAARARQLGDFMAVSVLLWIGSLVLCISNAILFLKSLTNESEVQTADGSS